VLIAVAVGTTYFAIRVVKKLRRSISGNASPPATGLKAEASAQPVSVRDVYRLGTFDFLQYSPCYSQGDQLRAPNLKLAYNLALTSNMSLSVTHMALGQLQTSPNHCRVHMGHLTRPTRHLAVARCPRPGTAGRTRLGSPYCSGRVHHWLKVKNPAAPAMTREAEEGWS
jgi:hypothetical protein